MARKPEDLKRPMSHTERNQYISRMLKPVNDTQKLADALARNAILQKENEELKAEIARLQTELANPPAGGH